MMRATAPDGSQQLPQADTRPRSPAGAPTIASVFKTAATRCFTVTELIDLLSVDTTPLKISKAAPTSPPPSGSIFLYDRLVSHDYKTDGHNWVRKRVSSKNQRSKVREDDVKLHLNRVPRVAGWYARSADCRTLRRRAYHLLGPAGSPPLNGLVLIHYLHDMEGGAKMPFLEAPVPAPSGPANKTRQGGKRKISVILGGASGTSSRDEGGGCTGSIGSASSPLVAAACQEISSVDSSSRVKPSGDPTRRGQQNGDDTNSHSCDGSILMSRLNTCGTTGGELNRCRRPDFAVSVGNDLPRSQRTDVKCHSRGSLRSEDDVHALSSPRSAAARLGVNAVDSCYREERSDVPARLGQQNGDGIQLGSSDVSIPMSRLGTGGTTRGEPSRGRRPDLAWSSGNDMLRSQRTDITCYGRGTLDSDNGVHAVPPLTNLLSHLAIIQAAPRISEEQMAQEWMSFAERERNSVISDIYGSAIVSSVPDRNSNGDRVNRLINKIEKESECLKLALLDEEVTKIPPAEKLAYLEALFRCPHLVSTKDVKLFFLRCEDWCPQAAARRLVRYWAKKVEIFGFVHAFFRLTLEGATALNCDDPTSWYCRLLPGTDASGRGVLFVDSTRRCNIIVRNSCLAKQMFWL